VRRTIGHICEHIEDPGSPQREARDKTQRPTNLNLFITERERKIFCYICEHRPLLKRNQKRNPCRRAKILGRDWKTIGGQCNEMEANVEVIVHNYRSWKTIEGIGQCNNLKKDVEIIVRRTTLKVSSAMSRINYHWSKPHGGCQ